MLQPSRIATPVCVVALLAVLGAAGWSTNATALSAAPFNLHASASVGVADANFTHTSTTSTTSTSSTSATTPATMTTTSTTSTTSTTTLGFPSPNNVSAGNNSNDIAALQTASDM